MALVDDAITTVNATLLANLSWLNNAFGKIQRMKKLEGTKQHVFPGAYVGGAKDGYVSVLPDSKHGNYCFWEIADPTDYEDINRNINVTFNFRVSFWFYWPDLYADYKLRSIEEVKEQILNVLVAAQYTRTIEVFKVYEDANSIFQNFSNQGYITAYDHKQIEGQFLMKPYGGVAFSGEIHSMPTCVVGGVTPIIPPNLFALIPANYSNSEQAYPLQTWYGERIYWKTYNLGSGANDLKPLPGLQDMVLHVRNEFRAVNAISGIHEYTTTQLIPDGSGGYEVFCPDFYTDIFLTVYYTK